MLVKHSLANWAINDQKDSSTAKIAILLQAAQVAMYNGIEQRRKGKIYESSFNKEDSDDLLHRGMTQYKGISWSKQ